MYKIVYDRRLVKVDIDKFILLINSGLDTDYVGYKKPAKSWEFVTHNNKKLLSIADIKEVAEKYENFNLAKARKHFFKEGEMRNYILSSINGAFFIEEAVTWDEKNNSLVFKMESKEMIVTNTTEILDNIENVISIKFQGRDFSPKKREFNKDLNKKSDRFFALCNPNGHHYLSGISINGYSFQKHPSDKIIKFSSPEEALSLINKFPILKDFKVRAMRTYDKFFVLRDESGQYYSAKRKYLSIYAPFINGAKVFKSESMAVRYMKDYNLTGLVIETVGKDVYLPA